MAFIRYLEEAAIGEGLQNGVASGGKGNVASERGKVRGGR